MINSSKGLDGSHREFILDNIREVGHWNITIIFLDNFVWLKITDEGSVPEMRYWSVLLIKFDLKWCTMYTS